MATCRKCWGEGQIDREDVDMGKGMMTCPDCHGDGEIADVSRVYTTPEACFMHPDWAGCHRCCELCNHDAHFCLACLGPARHGEPLCAPCQVSPHFVGTGRVN